MDSLGIRIRIVEVQAWIPAVRRTAHTHTHTLLGLCYTTAMFANDGSIWDGVIRLTVSTIQSTITIDIKTGSLGFT